MIVAICLVNLALLSFKKEQIKKQLQLNILQNKMNDISQFLKITNLNTVPLL